MKCPINKEDVPIPCNVEYCPFNLKGCKYKENMNDTDLAKLFSLKKKDISSIREEGLKNIETLLIVDKYYDFLREKYHAQYDYKQLVACNLFPFNFHKHKWTKFLLKMAFKKKNWEDFAKLNGVTHDISILGDRNETNRYLNH